jgi:hypothetical protein
MAGQSKFWGTDKTGPSMLWTLFVVLVVLWAVGVIGSFTMGGFLHVLLALALVTLLIQVLTARRPA